MLCLGQVHMRHVGKFYFSISRLHVLGCHLESFGMVVSQSTLSGTLESTAPYLETEGLLSLPSISAALAAILTPLSVSCAKPRTNLVHVNAEDGIRYYDTAPGSGEIVTPGQTVTVSLPPLALKE